MGAICERIRASIVHLLFLVLLELLKAFEHILESLELRELRVIGSDILCLQLLIFLRGGQCTVHKG